MIGRNTLIDHLLRDVRISWEGFDDKVDPRVMIPS